MFSKYNFTNYHIRGSNCTPSGPAAITDNNKYLPPNATIYNNTFTNMYRYPANYPCSENPNLYSKKSIPTNNLPLDCKKSCNYCC